MSELVPGCFKLDVTILRSKTFFLKMGIRGNRCTLTQLIQRSNSVWGWVGIKKTWFRGF